MSRLESIISGCRSQSRASRGPAPNAGLISTSSPMRHAGDVSAHADATTPPCVSRRRYAPGNLRSRPTVSVDVSSAPPLTWLVPSPSSIAHSHARSGRFTKGVSMPLLGRARVRSVVGSSAHGRGPLGGFAAESAPTLACAARTTRYGTAGGTLPSTGTSRSMPQITRRRRGTAATLPSTGLSWRKSWGGRFKRTKTSTTSTVFGTTIARKTWNCGCGGSRPGSARSSSNTVPRAPASTISDRGRVAR